MKLYDEYKQVVDFDIAHDIDRILISCSGVLIVQFYFIFYVITYKNKIGQMLQ